MRITKSLLVNALLGLTLTVSPLQSFAPATLQIKVSIDPAPANRRLVWGIYGDFSQQSERSLEGERAPRTHFLPPWKGVPPGDYEIRAVVYDAAGKIVDQATKVVRVLGDEP